MCSCVWLTPPRLAFSSYLLGRPSFVTIIFGLIKLLLLLLLLPIAGRLQFFVENWQVVTNDPWVLSAISGYHIPFTIIPHQDLLPSHKVSVEDKLLIDKQLGELVQKHAVHLVSEHNYNTGFVSNLFVIPKKGDGQRPAFNLRQLNHFIKYEHFKMEGIHMLRDLLKPNNLR